MKGEKKDEDPLELTMGILKTDYKLLVELMQEQKAMIASLPKGKERNFLQREYDDYVILVDNHIGFKRGLMERMGIQEDPNTYMYSEAQLAEIYDKLKNLHFGEDEDAIPNAH